MAFLSLADRRIAYREFVDHLQKTVEEEGEFAGRKIESIALTKFQLWDALVRVDRFLHRNPDTFAAVPAKDEAFNLRSVSELRASFRSIAESIKTENTFQLSSAKVSAVARLIAVVHRHRAVDILVDIEQAGDLMDTPRPMGA